MGASIWEIVASFQPSGFDQCCFQVSARPITMTCLEKYSTGTLFAVSGSSNFCFPALIGSLPIDET